MWQFRPRAFVLATALGAVATAAQAEVPPPPELAQVDIVERLGKRLPLELQFVGTTGKPMHLAEAFSGARPVILSLVYFRCPTLCGTLLQGLVRSLKKADLRPGKDVDLVTVSFDPEDGPQHATKHRARYLRMLSVADDEPVWPFLTGKENEIHALTEAVGFRYARIPRSPEFAHAAALFVVTPDGSISRYLYGVGFPERDLRLALAEASGGGWGLSFDRFLLHCFRYDPATHRYGVYISIYLKVTGLLILLGLFGLIGALVRATISAARRRAEAVIAKQRPSGAMSEPGSNGGRN